MAISWLKYVGTCVTVCALNLMVNQQLRAEDDAGRSRLGALAGLDGVLVEVGISDEVAAVLGVKKSAIGERVERRLEAGKVRNLSREESVRQGAAKLCVAVQSIRVGKSAEQLWRVDVSIREPVLLVRDPQRSIVATTWQGPSVVVGGEGVTAESAVKQLEEQIDNFARSYHEANKVR